METLLNWVANVAFAPGTFGVLIGASVSILTAMLTNRSSAKSARIRRTEDIRLAITQQRLDDYILLQKAFQQWMRAVTLYNNSLVSDGLFAANGNRIGRDDYSEQERIYAADVYLINNRIPSEIIRSSVEEAVKDSMMDSNDVESLKLQQSVHLKSCIAVLDSLGTEIRKLRDCLYFGNCL